MRQREGWSSRKRKRRQEGRDEGQRRSGRAGGDTEKTSKVGPSAWKGRNRVESGVS